MNSFYKHKTVIKLLIERDDIKVNFKNNNKRTLLLRAVMNEYKIEMKLLIK